MRVVHALLMGFVIGMSAAIFGACSTEPQCGPQSCAGCCTEDGRCMGGTLLQECGAAGAACIACSGLDLCQGGVCTPFLGPGRRDGGMAPDGGGTDGGSVDGGNLDGGTVPDAGHDGGWNAAVVGQPCTVSEECGGAPGQCIPPSSIPGGYCTANCTNDQALCGSTAACTDVGSGVWACLDRCASAVDCRTEYKCSAAPLQDGGFASALTCLPKCTTSCPAGYTCNTANGFCCNAAGCF